MFIYVKNIFLKEIYIKLLLNYVMKNRIEQNIVYTQFTYSPLQIWRSTNITLIEQIDIIIPYIERLKISNVEYNDIFIQFIIDMPEEELTTREKTLEELYREIKN